jgi:hypothetical protein
MSSGNGFGYSYVDVAAEERRHQLSVIAELNARLEMVRAQQAAVKAMGAGRIAVARRVALPNTDDPVALDAMIGELTSAVEAGEAAVGGALERHWGASLRRALEQDQAADRRRTRSRYQQVKDPAARSDRSRTGRTEASGTVGPEPVIADGRPSSAGPAVALRAAVDASTNLVAQVAVRCAPADLTRIGALCDSLAGLSSTAAIRDRAHEIRVAAAEAVRRHDAALRVETDRARLLALADETLPSERDVLRSEIVAAADPATLTQRVANGLDRADAARRRRAVAEITVRVLRGIGCVVTDRFDARLADEGLAVAPFEGSPYGLVVRFTAGRDRIATAVVRRDDEPADADRDLAAQLEFCATGLPALLDGWAGAGLGLRPFHRSEPGDPPPASFAAAAWGTAAQDPIAEAVQPIVRRQERGR